MKYEVQNVANKRNTVKKLKLSLQLLRWTRSEPYNTNLSCSDPITLELFKRLCGTDQVFYNVWIQYCAIISRKLCKTCDQSEAHGYTDS